MATALITDHNFVSIKHEREVLETAGFTLKEIKPPCKTAEDIIRTCGEADVLMVQWAPVTKQVLEALPKVKGIVRYGIGVDNFDIKGAKELGRMVANVPHYCQQEVSDHTLAFILSLGRRISHDDFQLKRGGWGIGPQLPIPAFSDLTLGLLGFGSIARKVSEKARPFRFKQIAYDPMAPDASFANLGVERVDRDTLLKTADIISLHCPLTDETRHIINAETIARMKPGALIINTARGPLINEADLVEGLQSGKLAGAGLDVYEKEPLDAASPLRSLPNVILTSHAASVSMRSIELLQIGAAEAARDILQGKRPYGALV